jgi:glycosyltransferase involved in cell wall biosynthesis
MDQSLLVSIIIPTYNDRSVVCDAIDCSLEQEYDNCEIIVVDDGSTDGTERLLKGKYGSRIKYIHQENKGLSSARNAGMRCGSGKYLQFLDADDLIDPSKIGAQVEQLQNISGLALAYCDYVRTNINDMSIVFENRVNPNLQKQEPFDDLMMKWETELSIPHHCFLFDAAIFRSHGIIYDENLPNHEDWECLMNVFALDPKIVFIDKKLANYRIRPDAMHTDLVKMRRGYLKGINKQIKKNRLNKDIVEKLKLRKKQIRYRYRDAGLLIRIMEGIHPKMKNKYIKRVPLWIQRILD